MSEENLKNLPAKNLLTFRDTRLLLGNQSQSEAELLIQLIFSDESRVYTLIFDCVSSVTLSLTLVASFLIHLMFGFGYLTDRQTMLFFNTNQFLMEDIVIGVVLPILIIFKTRKYLPRLWDDDCQIETNNNDFYAENPFQVHPMNDCPR